MPVRWSSTKVMLEKFFSMKDPINAVMATQSFDQSLDQFKLGIDEWLVCKELLDYFTIFSRTSIEMQADAYPTLNKVVPQYFTLTKRLQEVVDGTSKLNIKSPQLKDCAKAAITKLNTYYNKCNNQPTGFVATACDPRYKLSVFEWLWGSEDTAYRRAKNHFKETYRLYQDQDHHVHTFQLLHDEPSLQPPIQDEDEDDLFYGFKGAAPTTLASEIDTWLLAGTIPKNITDIQTFWKSKGYDFKTIARIAKDHMGVPATSAASERVFSNGGDIITKKRNRSGGKNTRYLLCLRSWEIIPEDDDNDELDQAEEEEEVS